MFEIYIAIILFIIFIFEIFSIDIFNNKEDPIENKKTIIIIPLSGFGENPIILDEFLDDLELSPFYSVEKINNYMMNNRDIYISKKNEKRHENIEDEINDINKPLADFENIFQEENDIYIYNATNNEKKNILKSVKNENNSEIIKDCVEYGLLEDNQDYIVCTRYE